MSKRTPSARNLRREEARAHTKRARDRRKLASLEPGGAAARPIEVESASQVEPHALGMACVQCEAAMRLLEHAAEKGLRVVRMTCGRCGAKRDVWFRIAPRMVH